MVSLQACFTNNLFPTASVLVVHVLGDIVKALLHLFQRE